METPKRVARVAGQDEIARLAYSYWEAGGRQQGTALRDWLRAERVLNGNPLESGR